MHYLECCWNFGSSHSDENDPKTDCTIIDDTMSEDQQEEVPMCPDHEGEKLYFFCQSCKVMVCQVCLVLTHPRPKHDVIDTKSTRRDRTKELNATLMLSEEHVEIWESRANLIIDLDKAVEDHLKAEMEKINAHIDAMVSDIMSKKEMLQEELRRKGKERIQGIQNDLSETINLIRQIRSAQEAAKAAPDNLPDHKFLEQSQALNDNLVKLCAEDLREFNTSIRVAEFQPDVNDIPPTVGVLIDLRILKLLNEFGKFGAAYNIASSPSGDLVVVDFHSKRVGVYQAKGSLETDKCKYKHESDINLSNTNPFYPRDVAVNQDGEIIVARVQDVEVYTSKGLLRFSTRPKQGQADVTQMEVASVAVGTNGQIIVGDLKQTGISIHQQDGTYIRTLSFEGIPNYLDTKDDYLAVSDTDGDKVTVVDLKSDQVISTIPTDEPRGISFNPKDTSETLMVISGKQTAVDPVKRMSQVSIDEYSYITGIHIRKIAEGLWSPMDLCVTVDGFVAVADRKTVKVYGNMS